jgi:uncharacterized protein YcaQ
VAGSPAARAPHADELSADDARRMALRAQGLLGEQERPASATEVLQRVDALQLDTISVLARSHELVCLARTGPLGAGAVGEACWGRDPAGTPRAFEYWAHAASILPIGLWPLFAFRRRHMRTHRPWHDPDTATMALVRHRLEMEGPMTATDLGGAKLGGQWWDWSPVKVAIEHLLAVGDVVCTTRRGWKRVYDLAERALPDALLDEDLDDATCLARLVARAGRRLGVATVADLADYYRVARGQVTAALERSGLVAVRVRGWAQDAWADPAALAALGRRGRHRTTLLSPFDSLIWDRARTERVFGYAHRLEAYVPAAKRVHGYYAMPVLAGGHVVGRVDPARVGTALVGRRVSVLRPSAVDAVADALRAAATWVGATSVTVDVLDPPRLRPALEARLD